MPVIAIRSVTSALSGAVSIISAVSVVLAWLGGVAFVLSLAYTGYVFGWVLANEAPANPQPLAAAAVVNVTLFGLFAAHHSVFARDAVKRRLMRVITPRFERSLYVWTSSLLLVAVLAAWQLVAGGVYRIDGPARWLFYVAQLAGGYLTVRSAGSIDPLELAGIRQAAQRPAPVRFRTDGPFSLVRHPIYLGWMLMTLGTPTMTLNRLLFATITSAYLLAAIPWEEASLESTFGGRYRTYRARVRWRVLPGIW
jgi:protein-S-isoprenylcysteine O-methyltransferase Ste14